MGVREIEAESRAFADRLRDALAKAKNVAATTTPPKSASELSFEDANTRLAAALKKARGEREPVIDEESTEPEQSGGPVGTGEHVVREGECISSIAVETGHFWETIWNDGANATLREARVNPNVLLIGDRVHIPEKRRKDESITPETRHRFRRRGEPSKLIVRFTIEDTPRANEPYVLTIDGVTTEGVTDANGVLNAFLPGNARRALVVLGHPGETTQYRLMLRELSPITEIVGVQQRLNNLDFDCGPEDGILNEETTAALSRFQTRYGLQATGKPDEATRSRLATVHQA